MTGPGGGPGDNIQLRMHDVTVCIRRYQKHQKKNKTVLLLKKKPFARVPNEKSARKTRRINARSLFKESASIFVVHRKTRASFSRLGEEISVQKSPESLLTNFPKKSEIERYVRVVVESFPFALVVFVHLHRASSRVSESTGDERIHHDISLLANAEARYV